MAPHANAPQFTPHHNVAQHASRVEQRAAQNDKTDTCVDAREGRQLDKSRVDRTRAHDRAVHVHVHVHVRRWWANDSVVDP